MSDEPQRTRGDRWATWLVGLACVIMLFATLTTWLQRQALNTEGWVSATDQLLADEEVRGALSVYLVDELYKAVSVEDAIAEVLPEDLDGLAPVLAGTIRQPASEAVDRLLATDEAADIWRTVSEEAHTTFIAVLNDDGSEALSTSGGAVTIDLGQLVQALAERVGLSGERIDELPEGVGVVTLFESDELEVAQDAVRIVERSATVLTVVVLGLFGAAIWISSDRRRTLRNIGLGFLIVGFLVLVARLAGVGFVVDLGDGGDQPALSVLDIGTSLLRQSGLTLVWIGAILAGFAIMVGPSRRAARVRAFLSPAMQFGTISAIGGGVVLALIATWFRASGPAASWIPVALFFAICLGGAVWLQRVTVQENAA